jgi:hypothetical protein
MFRKSVIFSAQHHHKPSVLSPEIGTTSIDWAKQSRFYLMTETYTSLRNVVF